MRRTTLHVAALLAVTGIVGGTLAVTSVRGRILLHLWQHQRLLPTKVDLLQLSHCDEQIPGSSACYYVEQKGTHGHRSYGYYIVDGMLFSSATDNDFGRLLQYRQFWKNGIFLPRNS